MIVWGFGYLWNMNDWGAPNVSVSQACWSRRTPVLSFVPLAPFVSAAGQQSRAAVGRRCSASWWQHVHDWPFCFVLSRISLSKIKENIIIILFVGLSCVGWAAAPWLLYFNVTASVWDWAWTACVMGVSVWGQQLLALWGFMMDGPRSVFDWQLYLLFGPPLPATGQIPGGPPAWLFFKPESFRCPILYPSLITCLSPYFIHPSTHPTGPHCSFVLFFSAIV